MLSLRDVLLLVLCSRLADTSPLLARHANTTLNTPTAYAYTSSSTISLAYTRPVAVDSSSTSTTCTTSAEIVTTFPPRESPSPYGLGVLTAPAPTTPPAATSHDFTFVGHQYSSESAAHFTYNPAQYSSSVDLASSSESAAHFTNAPEQYSSSAEAASASSYSTIRYRNVSTITTIRSTIATLYTTVQPKGYGASTTGVGVDVTVTSFTTIYPHAASLLSLGKPEQTASSSAANAYGSANSAYTGSSTLESSAIGTKQAPQYTSTGGEGATTTSSEHSTTTAETSTTLFAYSPPKDKTSSSSGQSIASSTQADTTSTSPAAYVSYTYPLPSSPSSEATTSAGPWPTAYTTPSFQTSLPPVIISPYVESQVASPTVAQSSTSTILGGITIVPVNPYSSASDTVVTVTVMVTVTDAGITKTVEVARETRSEAANAY